MHELRIESLTSLADLRAAEALLREVWGAGHGDAPLALDVMCALAHTGGYVTGAFLGDRLVGVAAGFRGVEDGLHSHIAGVLPECQGRKVGHALKLHQREWAAEHGINSVTWTFDPLVRRNAYFNLARLGAVVEKYLPDFYGPMADGINDGGASDRLFVRWSHDTPADPPDVPRATVLTEDLVIAPVTGGPLRCATPADIEDLRRTAPSQAREWREALRTTLGGALDAGYRVTGFTRDGYYLLDA